MSKIVSDTLAIYNFFQSVQDDDDGMKFHIWKMIS